MSDTIPKMRTITLTDRAPVRINEAEWPVIAAASYKDFDGQYDFQANRTWKIEFRVRQHADGRAIVYATYDYSSQFQNEAGEAYRIGVVLAPDDDRPTAIHRVRNQLVDRVAYDTRHRHIGNTADECIADLPAEAL